MAQEEPIRVEEYTFTAVFRPADEGGYVVTFPALRGCITEGDTLDEARAMAADALEGYLEGLRSLGRPIPVEDRTTGQPLAEPVRATLKTT